MKIRYCLTAQEKLRPCDAGWGAVGSEGCYSCWDEPMEKNCKNIVDTEDVAICPYCGAAIGLVGDFLAEKKPMFSVGDGSP